MTKKPKLFRFVIINGYDIEAFRDHDQEDYTRGDDLMYFEIELPKESPPMVPKFIRIK